MAQKNVKTEQTSFVNKELWGMSLAIASAFLFLCLVTGDSLIYPLGKTLQSFLLGALGYFSFPLLVFFFFYGVLTVIGKKVVKGKAKLNAVMISICLACCFAMLHLAFNPIGDDDIWTYSARVYNLGSGGFATASIGGVLFGFVDAALVGWASTVGTFAIWSIITVFAAFVALKDVIFAEKKGESEVSRKDKRAERSIESSSENDEPLRSSFDEDKVPSRSRSRVAEYSSTASFGKKRSLVVGGNAEFQLKKKGAPVSSSESEEEKRSNIDDVVYYSDAYDSDYDGKTKRAKSTRSFFQKENRKAAKAEVDKKSAAYRAVEDVDEPILSDDIYMPDSFKEEVSKQAAKSDGYVDIEKQMEEANNSVSDDIPALGGISLDEPLTRLDESSSSSFKRKTEAVRVGAVRRDEEKKSVDAEGGDKGDSNPYDEMPLNFKYAAPPLDLLKSYASQENYGESEVFKRDKAARIINTLKVLGGVEVSLANIVRGPTVTRFDIAIPDNVSIKTVMKYADDLKLRLETKNDIRITTIPGASLIGIEVANEKRSIVGLKEVIESDAFVNAKKSSLTFAIGKDIVGNSVVADLTKTLHLLIAGASGTGKSVGLNSLLISWFYKYSPADLRLVIVDPKLVEFKVFAGMPHLLFGDIITDAKTAVAMLNWAVKEMEARYAKMADLVVHNIDEYNDLIDPRKEKKLPKIVIIIDEFADLMSTDKKSIEEKIGRLAQKARAAGMYLILATQRPSVNIIEGSIKTNFISRMAFKMSNAVDSATIMGEGGAEKLLGNGDLLFKMGYMTNMERAQGAYIDMEEIKAVVNYVKENNACYFNEAAMKEISGEANPQIESVNGKEADESADGKSVPDYYVKALKIAVELRYISISLIQRKLDPCGFTKAAKIFDWMVNQGYVLNSQSGKQKQVTLTKEEFDELYGDYDV